VQAELLYSSHSPSPYFQDDVTIVLLIGVSFMIVIHTLHKTLPIFKLYAITVNLFQLETEHLGDSVGPLGLKE